MTKEPEVLDGTSISANVDFSLTKDDLTDMVLEDRFEVLEDQLNAVNKQIDGIKTEMRELDCQHEEHLKTLVKKAFDKRIKAAEKFFGQRATFEVEPGPRFYISKPDHILYVEYEQRFNSKRRSKVERHAQVDGWHVKSAAFVRVESYTDIEKQKLAQQKTQLETFESGSWGATKRFTDEQVAKMPAIKKLVVLDERRKALVGQSTVLKTELSNLETAGARARAKMVRALLGASEQGRQLLAKMPTMNQNLLTT